MKTPQNSQKIVVPEFFVDRNFLWSRKLIFVCFRIFWYFDQAEHSLFRFQNINTNTQKTRLRHRFVSLGNMPAGRPPAAQRPKALKAQGEQGGH